MTTSTDAAGLANRMAARATIRDAQSAIPADASLETVYAIADRTIRESLAVVPEHLRGRLAFNMLVGLLAEHIAEPIDFPDFPEVTL